MSKSGALNIGSLIASIGGDISQLQIALKQAEAEMNKTSGNMSKSLQGFNESLRSTGEQMKSMGKSMSLYLSAPLLAQGTVAFKMASEFSHEMKMIIGLVGVSKDKVDEWSKQILELGPKLGKSPIELAKAMFFITSAGIRGAEAMDVLTMAAKGSVAGMGETVAVADAAVSAMNAYGKENLSAASAVDVLTMTVREGKMAAEDVAPVLGAVIPIAAEMGVSFDQVGAALAAMTRTGMNSHIAATSLKAILTSLLKPTEEAKMQLLGMGSSAEQMRKTLKEKGLLQALMDLREMTSKYGEEAIADVIPNVRALSGTLSLMGRNLEDNKTIFKNLANAAGTTDFAFNVMADGMGYKYKQAVTSMKTAFIEFGKSLKVVLIPVFEAMTKIFQKLSKLWEGFSDNTKKIIVIVMGLVTAFGPLLIVLGKVMTVVSTLITGGAAMAAAWLPVVAVITAVAGAFFLVAKWQQETKQAIEDIGGIYAKNMSLESIQEQINLTKQEIDSLKESTSGMGNFIKNIPSIWGGRGSDLKSAEKQLSYLEKALELKQKQADAEKAFQEDLKKTEISIKEGFGQGKGTAGGPIGLIIQLQNKIKELQGIQLTLFKPEEVKAYQREIALVQKQLEELTSNPTDMMRLPVKTAKEKWDDYTAYVATKVSNLGQVVAEAIPNSIRNMGGILNKYVYIPTLDITQEVTQMIMDSMEMIGTIIGRALSKQDLGLKDILFMFADWAINLGKVMMAAGLALMAFKTQIFANPMALAIWGGALIAAGAAVKAAASANPTTSNGTSSNGSNSQDNYDLKKQRELMQFNVNVNGTVYADGTQLAIVLNNENKRRAR